MLAYRFPADNFRCILSMKFAIEHVIRDRTLTDDGREFAGRTLKLIKPKRDGWCTLMKLGFPNNMSKFEFTNSGFCINFHKHVSRCLIHEYRGFLLWFMEQLDLNHILSWIYVDTENIDSKIMRSLCDLS